MITPYRLGIDVWEGQLEIDEAVLKANDVKFMFIRLNDMNGGHHMDEGFLKQWAEAVGFYRAPYFVYNPWVSGQANFDWLNAHMPADARVVAIDIEVKKSDVTPTVYAYEVAKFVNLVSVKWKRITYTGEWFLPYLAYWPAGDYWWAQYPYALYPPTTTTLTWPEFVTKLNAISGVINASKCPGTIRFWQCSGDKFILPGSNRVIDINVFFGDDSALENFFGSIPTTPPPPTGLPDTLWIGETKETVREYKKV